MTGGDRDGAGADGPGGDTGPCSDGDLDFAWSLAVEAGVIENGPDNTARLTEAFVDALDSHMRDGRTPLEALDLAVGPFLPGATVEERGLVTGCAIIQIRRVAPELCRKIRREMTGSPDGAPPRAGDRHRVRHVIDRVRDDRGMR